jgi:hypothetical protein
LMVFWVSPLNKKLMVFWVSPLNQNWWFSEFHP